MMIDGSERVCHCAIRFQLVFSHGLAGHMACIAMAYIVMACIVKACMVTACIIPACIVVAYIAMAYIVMALYSYGTARTDLC